MSNNNTSLQQPSDTKNTSTPTVVHSLSSSRESTSPPQQLVQPELSSSTYLHSPSPLAKRSHIEYFQSTPQPPENAASETLDSDAVSLFFRTSPRVTPAGTSTTSNYNRFPIPSPRPNLTSHINPLSPPAPQPKYNMASADQHPQGYLPPHPHAHPALPHPLAHGHPAHPHTKGKEVEVQHPNEMAAPSKHGHGVEMVLKASETAAQNERGQVHTTGHGHHDYFKSTVGARPPTTNTGVSGTTSTMGHGYGPQGQQGQPVNNNKLTQDDGKDALQYATYTINQGQYQGQTILAFMGTVFSNIEQVVADIWSTPMSTDLMKNMANEAKDVAERLNPDFITGHSLGGIIAEMVCSMTGIKGASFGAIGAFDPFTKLDEVLVDAAGLA